MIPFHAGALQTPRLTLVLEGARRDAQWALFSRDRAMLVGARIKDRAAAERCPAEVEAGAAALGHDPSEIDAICVGLGPGSYAGLRITLAFAKGLALASRAKLVGVASLEAMLLEPSDGPPPESVDDLLSRGLGHAHHHVAIMNAFAGLVFAHGRAPDGSLWIATDAYEPAVLRVPMQSVGSSLQVTSDGPLPMAEALGVTDIRDLKTVGADIPFGVLALGLARISRGEQDDPRTLIPDYGRASSAELKAIAAGKPV
jgi:tRNA threonylcarbamoyl adenosine modification protein YeaZ